MYRDNRLRARADRPAHRIRRNLEVLIHIHDHRRSAQMDHDVGGCAERQGGHDDFIARANVSAASDACSAAVQELTAMACFAPT